MRSHYAVLLLLLSTKAVAAQQASLPEAEALRRVTPVPNHEAVLSKSDLEKTTRPLIESAAATGRATRTILNVPTHRILFVAVSSKKTPPAEYHLAETDIWTIESGQGWVQIGGEIADPVTTAGGDLGGTAIRGGKKFRATAGDIFNIPSKTAHQALLDAGGSMTYFVVKVKESHTADYFLRP